MSLVIGAPAPWFHARTPSNPKFTFSSLGGRYVLLAFLPPPGAQREAALAALKPHRPLLNDVDIAFFGLLRDEASCAQAKDQIPGIRWFFDPAGEVSRLYGLADDRAGWVLIDPMMRLLAAAPIDDAAAVLDRLPHLGRADDHSGAAPHAPVLIVPRVFDPEFCQTLIDHYDADGGQASGVMREVDGKTVHVLTDFKRRRDAVIDDEALQAQIRSHLSLRLLPQIEKAFQFQATRIERYIVARYDADDGGWFQPHRDNTTRGTAHRRFAVSINLNGGFEGGDLRFAEFGQKTYRPPPGGAVVFSCSLLHEATPVTAGVRYACLPFLYDEAGAAVREANARFLEGAAAAKPARKTRARL